jgi:hypothetical protein
MKKVYFAKNLTDKKAIKRIKKTYNVIPDQ